MDVYVIIQEVHETKYFVPGVRDQAEALAKYSKNPFGEYAPVDTWIVDRSIIGTMEVKYDA